MSNADQSNKFDELNAGEKEPQLEVVFDNEHYEPSRKRPRSAENPGSSGEIMENLIAEGVEKIFKLRNVEESIEDIHKATLEISDFTVSRCAQLEERILGMENEAKRTNEHLESHLKRVEIGVILKQVTNQKLLEKRVDELEQSLKAKFEVRENENREMTKRVDKLEELKMVEITKRLEERILKMEVENLAVKMKLEAEHRKNENFEEQLQTLQKDSLQKAIQNPKLEERIQKLETEILEIKKKDENREVQQKEIQHLESSKLEEKILIMEADIMEVKIKNQSLEMQQKDLKQTNEQLQRVETDSTALAEKNQHLESRISKLEAEPCETAHRLDERIQKAETGILELKESLEVQQEEAKQTVEQLQRLKKRSREKLVENKGLEFRISKLENRSSMSQEEPNETINRFEDDIRKVNMEVLELQARNDMLRMEQKDSNGKMEEQVQKNAVLHKIVKGVQKAIIENQTSIKRLIPEYREKISTLKNSVEVKLQILGSELKIMDNDFQQEKNKIRVAERDSAQLCERLEKLEQTSTDEMEHAYEEDNGFESQVWGSVTEIEKKVEQIQKYFLKTNTTSCESDKPTAPHISPVQCSALLSSDQMPLTRAELEFASRCIFCNTKNHKSIDCGGVSQVAGRIRVLSEKQRRCLKCLEVLSDAQWPHVCPRERVVCSNCQWDTRQAREDRDFHHPLVCPLNDKSVSGKNKREKENERRRCHGLAPRFDI